MQTKLEQSISLFQIALVAIMVVFGTSTAVPAAKEVSNAVADFSTLNLKVTGVRIVDKIEENDIISGKPRVTWSANAPDKLVVVTLEGQVPAENYYTFMPDSFALFCEYQTNKCSSRLSSQDEIKTVLAIKQCRAIRILSGTVNNWSIRGHDYSVIITHLLKPGLFKMEIGAIVPAEAKNFTVIIPVSIPSQVMVPSTAETGTSKTQAALLLPHPKNHQ
jgi:hypothetical protein